MAPPSNAERGAATREQLVRTATALFAENGYEATSIESLLAATGMSRGSLYHHFKGKDALFAAVLEAVELDVGRRVLAAAGTASDPLGALRAGCRAWVELAGDPVVRRILLLDAPAVLGWQRWRELDERYALGMIRQGLSAVSERGGLDESQVDVFAHVLMASMNELALLVARSETRAAEATSAIDELLERLLTPR